MTDGSTQEQPPVGQESIDLNLRTPVAERFAHGLLVHHDNRAELAGKTESGELDMDSEAGERVKAILAEIDSAREEGRSHILLRTTKNEIERARQGHKSMPVLGPAKGRAESFLDEELKDALADHKFKSGMKRLRGKISSFFRR